MFCVEFKSSLLLRVLCYFFSGVPLEPSTSVVVMVTTVTTSSTSVVVPSATSQVSMSVTSNIVGASSTSGQATPTNSVSMATMSPSTSPGGASTLIVEWTLLLSLLIMTIVGSLIVL